jgi:hypothetical protein
MGIPIALFALGRMPVRGHEMLQFRQVGVEKENNENGTEMVHPMRSFLNN